MLQVRVLVFSQSLLHLDQTDQGDQAPLITHRGLSSGFERSAGLQFSSSVLSPGQSAPPLDAGGLLQCLVLVFKQVDFPSCLLLQELHAAQLPQLPSTGGLLVFTCNRRECKGRYQSIGKTVNIRALLKRGGGVYPYPNSSNSFHQVLVLKSLKLVNFRSIVIIFARFWSFLSSLSSRLSS